MDQKLRDRLFRLALTFLLASGLLLPLLGALNLSASIPECLLLCVLLSALSEALTMFRKALLPGLAVLFLVLAVWAAGGGFSVLRDTLTALSLHVSGIPGALPLAARSASLFLTFLLTVLSFVCTRKSAGYFGSTLLVVGALMVLWLADLPELTLQLLPACVAALSLYLLDRHGEASPGRIIPWAALLVLLAWFCTPSSGLVSPDLKEKADELRQNIMDRLFFTEPRDVFSLSSEGYYPQGVSQLGGPVTPSDRPVMQVSSPRTVYLRGVTMNAYDGRAWRNTLGGRRYLWDAPAMAERRAVLFDQQLPSAGLSASLTEPQNVSVRMLTDSASTLFAPQRIRTLRAGGDLVPYFSNSSELFVTRNLQPGDTWSLSAPLFQSGDPGVSVLVEAAASAGDPQYESVLETYTVLPPHLEEPVWQLASDVTEGLSSPYEKAFALQTWLSRNYRYTLDVAVQPANIDFVTNFLFNTREGYCTYYASALTVLCRMAGLPARYVEGYLAVPDARGEALVTGRDAHAWTEVYFNGFGWLTFDATPRRTDGSSPAGEPDSPSSPEPSPTPEPSSPPPEKEETPSPEPRDEPDPTRDSPTPAPSSSGSGSPDETGSPSSGFPWLLLILLLFSAAVCFRWIRTDPARIEKRLSAEEDRFDLWLSEVFRRLSSMGLSRQSGETPMSFTRRLDREGTAGVPLSSLGECASLLHYGRVHAQPADTALARDAALSLKKAMPLRPRVLYAFRRMISRRSAGFSE